MVVIIKYGLTNLYVEQNNWNVLVLGLISEADELSEDVCVNLGNAGNAKW
jgi:hypothetical protein